MKTGEAEEKLRVARLALERAERQLGVRSPAQSSILPERSGTVYAPVIHVPPVGLCIIRCLIDIVPPAGWVGFVGIPNFGWEAAYRRGVDLSRVLVVRHPGTWGAQICALMLDALDVVCVGEVDIRLPQRRRLAARARRDGRTVMTTCAWPGISRPWSGELPAWPVEAMRSRAETVDTQGSRRAV
ncbi:hypothetical protein G7Y41_04515 [Schaalia sp. ZJ405]|uniref:hypothetical protein n=1 Tax=Schaalia sp. ZJ405 TaxID=2709403 RepID=UPI0013ED9BD4|nr:hypothetical protein [Schaalia sp. ZJ405]QPK82059.1 hypothetical protein G7Y41_04515 [Schaalia sp. ZJ405]